MIWQEMEHIPVILLRLQTSLTREGIRIVEALHKHVGNFGLLHNSDGKIDTYFLEALTRRAYGALNRVGENERSCKALHDKQWRLSSRACIPFIQVILNCMYLCSFLG